MKMIPTKVHGVFDYIGGAILLFAPNIFGFAHEGGAAVLIPRIIGLVVLIQSVLTNYELGLLKILPMKIHLMNDYIAATLLALSPWIFGFSQLPANAWMPHLVAGVAIFVLTLMTQREPRQVHGDASMRHAQ
ncbi:MAG: SPW repeat protein [Verrucomicrobia bacterium]|nr:SPW repeat protein [Verrucomicrobiota bacterium]